MTMIDILAPTIAAPRRCCGTSVGGRIRRWNRHTEGWEYLLQGRAWHPRGWAPPAGHAQDKGDLPWEQMMAEECDEELGLTMVSSTLLVGPLRLPNLCASLPSLAGGGHTWRVYDLTVTGTLAPDPEETTGARWVKQTELQAMADATIAHALTGGAARDLPEHALEAVWVQLLALTGDITAAPMALAAVAELYATPPERYWLGEAFEEELPAFLARQNDPAPELLDALALEALDQRLLVGTLAQLAAAGHPRPALERIRVGDMTTSQRARAAITSTLDRLHTPTADADETVHASHEALLTQSLSRGERFHGPTGHRMHPDERVLIARI